MPNSQPDGQEFRTSTPPQVVEDWLFAYVNARTESSRAMMWPHLVEAVEELIADSKRLYARQKRQVSSSA
ncbi:MAG: hypothetical protein HQM06_00140 [Magnetococcales bacterium]|nr:hypothetical protein [Magnetococcales bacterium]